jgi:hypothetical protein
LFEHDAGFCDVRTNDDAALDFLVEDYQEFRAWGSL